MVWEANPDEFQLALHPFGVTVEEFGGDAFRRPEYPAKRPCKSRCPVRAHDSMIRTTGLLFNSQLAHTGLQ
jgi:hypothetical protein